MTLPARAMKLVVTAPMERVVEADASAVIAESPAGSFCLLPRHRDVVAPLVPGLLLYRDPAGRETTLAIDEGILVKCGSEVRVACRRAIASGDLGSARATVEREFRARTERERRARTALARLELDIVRRLGELGRSRG